MTKVKMHVTTRGDGIDETVWYWYVFPREIRNRKITRLIALSGYNVESEECYHSYDCCGRFYGSGLYIERRGSRALASISVSRNV